MEREREREEREERLSQTGFRYPEGISAGDGCLKRAAAPRPREPPPRTQEILIQRVYPRGACSGALGLRPARASGTGRRYTLWIRKVGSAAAVLGKSKR